VSPVLRQIGDLGKGKALTGQAAPSAVVYRTGAPNVVRFTDGSESLASCLRCHDAPCMLLRDDEMILKTFPDFPADRAVEVCPSGAISREGQAGAPTIDASRCVYCGACVSRCPVGAIHLDPKLGAVIQDDPTPKFIETPDHPEQRMRETRERFSAIRKEGVFLEESDELVKEIEYRLGVAGQRVGDRFPDLLARSLFLTAGVSAAMRRKGNNNMRMDMVLGPPGVERGVAEVEFGDEAILDSPRDILDDIAVLVSRYGWDKKQVVALVVGDVLPNRRSEYWRIIQDIAQVLGIRIGTVTVFALMLTAWNRKVLQLTPDNLFYVDCDTDSYRARVLDSLLGRSLKLGSVPCSFVEVAK
jgi:ferredoxin